MVDQPHVGGNREDNCLQTLLFKCANHRNKRHSVLTANEAMVSTLMTISDVNDIFALCEPFLKAFVFLIYK